MNNELDKIKNDQGEDSVTVERVDSIRVLKEVEGAIVMAKKFPRDINAAYSRIISACKRMGIAKSAMYSYPRGGKLITKPGIRLAEVLVQNFGNIQYTVREIDRNGDESEVESSCWDLETNFRSSKTFKVKHIRDTKQGQKKLTAERDIYELIANMGARRGRACILVVIPADIVQDAIAQCEKTLSGSGKPIDTVVREMLPAFKDLGVTKEMIEKYLNHTVDKIDHTEMVELIKIFNSIKDGVSKRTDFFKLEDAESDTNDLIDKKLNKENSSKS